MRKKIPWPPAALPKNFPLTPYKDGYCKSINGKWCHITGKTGPREALKIYNEKFRRGDFDKRVRANPNTLTIKEIANLYDAWLNERMRPGHTRKLNPRTYDDYFKAIQLFIDTPVDSTERVADLRVDDLTARDFAAYMKRIPGKSPYTRSRYVAAIKAMFHWSVNEGYATRPPIYGLGFVKASVDELREARADLQKSFTREEIRKIIIQCGVESVWYPIILLALNGAFSNKELAGLRIEQIDLDSGIVQSVRGKRGRAYRKTVLWPITIKALKRYSRPTPINETHADLFFVTRNGLPYVRLDVEIDETESVESVKRRDTLSVDFGKLVDRAELPREGRSFSGLRTTFRTEAESMPDVDREAIDMILGHPRRHISSEYVERFPVHRLKSVTEFVFKSLFSGFKFPTIKRKPSASK